MKIIGCEGRGAELPPLSSSQREQPPRVTHSHAPGTSHAPWAYTQARADPPEPQISALPARSHSPKTQSHHYFFVVVVLRRSSSSCSSCSSCSSRLPSARTRRKRS